jgi:uncharacterized protein YlxW (UPF0749 family)
MKTIFIFGLLLVATAPLRAQVRETTASMSAGTRPALEVELPVMDKKAIVKAWSDFIKDYKAKVSTKRSDEVFADNAVIKSLNGNNTVDLYAMPSVGSSRAYLTVWFDLGGAYLSRNTHATEYVAAEKLLMDFASQVGKVALEAEVAAEERKLKVMEAETANFTKDNEKLQKENDQMEKEIEALKQKIEQNRATIQKNQTEQTNKQREVESQRDKSRGLQTKLRKM